VIKPLYRKVPGRPYDKPGLGMEDGKWSAEAAAVWEGGNIIDPTTVIWLNCV
jgi:hypothetical protein